MSNRIILNTCVEEPTQGASPLRVLVFAAADLQRYFVKCVKKSRVNDHHTNDVRQLANEYICARIANRLGLCCPVGEICEFSASSQSGHVQNLGIVDGPYFGSKEVSNLGTFESNGLIIEQCKNKESVPLLILFESYVCNTDMQDKNVLLGEDQNLWIIDHANSFGGAWENTPAIDCNQKLSIRDESFKSARLIMTEAKKVFTNVSTASALFEYFREKINADFIYLIVEDTPSQWLSDSQKIALRKVLQCRLRNLEQLVDLQSPLIK